MEFIQSLNLTTEEIILYGVVTFILILQFLFIIILLVKTSNLKKRLKKFLPEDKEMDIEKMLVDYVNKVENVLEREEMIQSQISENKKQLSNDIETTNKLICLTNEKLKEAVQKVSIVRYNPFEEVGGDLCFAIALLDDNNNGVILNSIYSRDACYTYAKEIKNGVSPVHKLSAEESEALSKALNK